MDESKNPKQTEIQCPESGIEVLDIWILGLFRI
jgi:hypothetical protein